MLQTLDAHVECFPVSSKYSLLSAVGRLAQSYPHPHSKLGQPNSPDYVVELQRRRRDRVEGWYVCRRDNSTVAAVHLAVYGVGDGTGHRLWKLRHPLCDASNSADLTALLKYVMDNVLRQPGRTNKVLLFLSEHERRATKSARDAGLVAEGRCSDYYRLGESVFIFGATLS